MALPESDWRGSGQAWHENALPYQFYSENAR